MIWEVSPCHRPAGGQLCEQRGTCPTWSWRLHVSCSSCQDHCELLPLTWWPPSLPPCWPHSLPLDLCTGCSFCYFGVGFYEPVNCHTGLFVADSWPCAHSTKDLTSKLTWKPNQIRVPPFLTLLQQEKKTLPPTFTHMPCSVFKPGTVDPRVWGRTVVSQGVFEWS